MLQRQLLDGRQHIDRLVNIHVLSLLLLNIVIGAKTKGAAFLDAMREDGKESGAEGVENPPAPEDKDPVNAARAKAKADAAAYLESRKGRK